MLRQPTELKKFFRESKKDEREETPNFAEVFETWKKLSPNSSASWVILIGMVGQLRIKETLNIHRENINFETGNIEIKKRSEEKHIINIGFLKTKLKEFVDFEGVRNCDRVFFSEYKNIESAYRMFRYYINYQTTARLTEREKGILLNTDKLKIVFLFEIYLTSLKSFENFFNGGDYGY